MKDLLSDVQNSTTSAHDVFQKQHHSDDRIPSFWGRENKDDTWKPRYDTKKVYKIINAYKQLVSMATILVVLIIMQFYSTTSLLNIF